MTDDTSRSDEELSDILEKTIPDFYALMVINKKGNLLSYFVSEQCADERCLTELKEIAKLTSIRFKIGEFHKTLGGLELTINMFKNYFSLVRTVFQDNFLVVIVPRETSFLFDSIKAVPKLDGSLLLQQKGRTYFSKERQKNSRIKLISSKLTSFEKSQEKLAPERFFVVKNANFKTESK